jgi:glycosyltransferase involved in cell wall biosynthesis
MGNRVMPEQVGFTINASRIGATGGLRTYAETIFRSLSTQYDGVDIVLPRGVPVPEDAKAFVIPAWLSSSSRVSRLRPLLWLIYSSVLFPGKGTRRIFSTTHHALPFHSRQILTVHDLRPYFEPDTWVQKFYFHRILGGALRRCDGIITVSESSKRDIIAIYAVAAERIFVVHNAIDVPPTRMLEQLAHKEVDPPYLLMVGATWKHKNAMEVLEEHRCWTSHFRLKILAGTGQYAAQLRKRVTDLGISDKVDFLQATSEAALADLYQGCAALVYPSRMEGFGLPPLEAMAYGKPAIVSDIPVFRELFSDAPYYVELGNSTSWKHAFSELLKRDSQMRRREEGLSVAAKYSRKAMDIALKQALESIWGPTLIRKARPASRN